MLAFVSFFLGLTVGSHPVEVAVAGRPAVVELRLDGRTVGERRAPPWRFACDFGTSLVPHRLEAVAFDGERRELDRVRQWVNYRRASYEAVIVLGPVEGTSPRRGRVEWASIWERPPRRLTVTFDGRRLPVDAEGSFALPPHDPDLPHHVAARLDFDGGETAASELTFGGLYGDRVTSALTAVPVLVPPGSELPPAAALGGWFEVGGEPLPVFSTERPAGVVVVVRDLGAERTLGRLARELPQRGATIPPGLDAGDEVYAVETHPVERGSDVFRLFRVPRSFLGDGLRGLLAVAPRRPRRRLPQQLGESLAVAGKHAVESDRPRAVLLVVGRRPEDRGRLSLQQAAGYLRALRVPLFVWVPDDPPATLVAAFSGRPPYRGADGLVELLEALGRSLADQRIVWLEGEGLPGDVRLGSAAAGGFRLAG